MDHVDKACDVNEKKNEGRREKEWFYKSLLILSQPIMINLPRGASGPCMHIIFQLFTLLSSSSSFFFLPDLLFYIWVSLSPQVSFGEGHILSFSVDSRVSITNGWFFFCFLHSHGNMFIWFKNYIYILFFVHAMSGFFSLLFIPQYLMCLYMYRCSTWLKNVWSSTWAKKSVWKLCLSMQTSLLSSPLLVFFSLSLSYLFLSPFLNYTL